MAYTVTITPWVSTLFLVYVAVFCCKIGEAYADAPYTVIDEHEPGTGTVGGGQGVVGDDPPEIVAKALLCFNNKKIYSSCEESNRLKLSGQLHVPPEDVDQYCNGPCLTETDLVLNCVEGIMENFKFYNSATIKDIRDTIKAGCGEGPERGDFNVEGHLQAAAAAAAASGSCKTRILFLYGLGFIIAGHAFLP